MGYRLAGEVLDQCPDLPYRQFRVLMVLALDATDSTRQAMPGLDAVALLGNCGHRTAQRALDALRAAGLIKTVRHSGPNRTRAIYEVLPAPGTHDSMVAPDTHDSMVAPGRGYTRQFQHQHTSKSGSTHDTSLARTKPSAEPSTELTAAAPPPPTAQTILAAFIDWDTANGGQLTKRTTGQLAKQIADLLAEGVGEEPIKRGLADWRDRGQHPSVLHSFVDAAMNGHPITSRRENERQAQLARQLERARRLDAAERGET